MSSWKPEDEESSLTRIQRAAADQHRPDAPGGDLAAALDARRGAGKALS